MFLIWLTFLPSKKKKFIIKVNYVMFKFESMTDTRLLKELTNLNDCEHITKNKVSIIVVMNAI